MATWNITDPAEWWDAIEAALGEKLRDVADAHESSRQSHCEDSFMDEATFEGRYYIDDGYPTNDRPHYVMIHRHDIDATLPDEQLVKVYQDLLWKHFVEHTNMEIFGPGAFVAWVRSRHKDADA